MFQIPASQMSEHSDGYMPVELGTVGTAEYGSWRDGAPVNSSWITALKRSSVERLLPSASASASASAPKPSCRTQLRTPNCTASRPASLCPHLIAHTAPSRCPTHLRMQVPLPAPPIGTCSSLSLPHPSAHASLPHPLAHAAAAPSPALHGT
eukprot:355160-Chlamydomonas_euryale.AAC.1